MDFLEECFRIRILLRDLYFFKYIVLYIHCRMNPSNLVHQVMCVPIAQRHRLEDKIYQNTFLHILENNHLNAPIVVKDLLGKTIVIVISGEIYVQQQHCQNKQCICLLVRTTKNSVEKKIVQLISEIFIDNKSNF